MKTRVISAVVAVALLIAMFYFGGRDALFIVCSVVALGCIVEYARLIFLRTRAPKIIRIAFIGLALGVFVATAMGSDYALAVLALSTIAFLTLVLLTVKTTVDLAYALALQGAGGIGLIYCGLFPAFTILLLGLPAGTVWLFGLLAIVFSGDTCAYLAGRAMGKRKLLEPVSPKKTIAGAVGGLTGSALAGLVLGLAFLQDYPLWALVFSAVVTGAFAQIGDLFESMIKRVADVKDSGAIMPGHGGILDRLDGVLFGAPVFYVLGRFLA